MSELYPLRFEPLFRRYLWGGRRLASLLGKALGDGDDYAESWEVVDHGPDQSVVSAGPLQGSTLGHLAAEFGVSLYGRHFPQSRFPLLFKFLDAHRDLSVQVHPDDAAAARLDPPDLGKTEAWVILHAEPDSLIYAGLQAGIDQQAFRQRIIAGQTESCLHRFTPRVGDCIFIPAGTVHALGAGLVVAEIQQASDTTYRLFDWNRVGADGNPRPLHVESGLEVADFQRGPVQAVLPQSTSDPAVETLVSCDKFILNRWRFAEPRTVGGDRRFHLLVVLRGSLRIAEDPTDQPLVRGQAALLPACLPATELAPSEPTVLLDIHLPD